MLSSLTGKSSSSIPVYHRLASAPQLPPACRRPSRSSISPVAECSSRHYASSSKPARAAAATAMATVRRPPPVPLSSVEVQEKYPFSGGVQMRHTLPTRIPLTFLPTPLPQGEESAVNSHFFPSSRMQQVFSIMDALLMEGRDVPRAGLMFDRIRAEPMAQGTFGVDVYNSFLGAYLGQALRGEQSGMWLKKLWSLFHEMMETEGQFSVRPNVETFAIALLAIVKFSPTSSTPVSTVLALTPDAFLRSLLQHGVTLTQLIQFPLLETDLAECSRVLRLAAVESGRPEFVAEIGRLTVETPAGWVDPLEGVPEVTPVLARKTKAKSRRKAAKDEDMGGATATDEVTPSETGDMSEQSPYNLRSMQHYLRQVAIGRRTLPDDPAARQRMMEESAYQVALERWRHESDTFEELGIAGRKLGQSTLRKWMWTWYVALEERLRNEIPTVIDQEKARPHFMRDPSSVLGPYLRLLETSKLAMLTIMELMRIQGTGGIAEGMKTARAVITVGRAVEVEYDAELQRMRKRLFHMGDHVLTSSEGGLAELAARRDAARQTANDDHWRPDWTQVVRARVGSFLIDALMDVAKVTRTGSNRITGEEVTEEQPAFVHGYEFVRGRKLGVIKLNAALLAQFAKDPVRDALHPRQLPMLVAPRPWLGHESGGYMYSRTSVMRFKDSVEQLAFLRSASDAGNLELIYASLDVLGSTPWTINRLVFDVVLRIWNSGEGLADIPPLSLNREDPVKPDDYDTNPKAKNAYLMELQDVANERRNNHSIRCDVNYKVEIARSFLGERFYQPHNVDFRGRAYPIPPHLNHIGNDLCRGLLTFADKRALGEKGLRWLKIHLANKYGYDKASFEERLNFTMEHLEDVFDSAEKPLEGRRWWLKGDDPWQTLAACMELHAALSSGDPLNYLSSLPIHQDGTCNGLQHYAALGGDDQGARQVNLDVADRPSDVYTYVADMVEKTLEREAGEGMKEAQMLVGKVSRKVVKQTVMTTVYGVTFVGARDQILKQLEARHDIPKDDAFPLATFLARRVLACIGDLFKGAKSIQEWLNQTAWLISRSIPPERLAIMLNEQPASSETNQPAGSKKKAGGADDGPVAQTVGSIAKEQMTSVIWTTPLGLPVAQPYRKLKKRQVFTALQSVFISDPNLPTQVNTLKQASAFPPNFIHSLDATHMMLTALGCRNANVTYASVHDSYWTHAATIDDMSAVIRDTFVTLHSTNILQNLVDEIRQRYKGYKIPVVAFKSRRKIIAGCLNVHRRDLDQLKAAGEVTLDVKASDVPTEDEEDGDSPAFESNARANVDDTAVRTRFVELGDMIQPLPRKGTFDVKKIKNSLYFFS